MTPSELRKRLLRVGAVEVPVARSPRQAELWVYYRLGGEVFEVPRSDDVRDVERHVAESIEEIRDLVGVRLDWPAWLDEKIDRCPVCGGDVLLDEGDDGWEIGCPPPCRAAFRGDGPRPTWAERDAGTWEGRRRLREMGHPLGGAG